MLLTLTAPTALPAVAMENCNIGGPYIGTSGDDTNTGSNNRDLIQALAGNDTVDARGGNDVVYGGAGNDSISGGRGKDVIFGGTGDDFINVRGDNSRDFVYCGPGNDTVNNMPGPGPADFFAGDCEEFVY